MGNALMPLPATFSPIVSDVYDYGCLSAATAWPQTPERFFFLFTFSEKEWR